MLAIAWELSVDNFRPGSLLGKVRLECPRDLFLGIFRFETFAKELRLGNIAFYLFRFWRLAWKQPFVIVALEPSLGNFRLGSVAWCPSLVGFRSETLAWVISHGNFRLET